MNRNIDLGHLPLIVFSAEIVHGQLHLSGIAGGLPGITPASADGLDAALHPDSRNAFMTPTRDLARQLVRLRGNDGNWHWLNLHIGQLSESSTGVRYTGLLTDARHDKILLDTAQRYRDFTEISSDWYWEMDAQHRFTYFSREFEEVTGVASSSALGKTRWEGLGRERIGKIDWESHIATMNAQRPFRNFEYPSRRQDGRIIWFRVSGRPRYDDNGVFAGYYGIASDISATRHIEERLQQSERLASIGQLAAGVAHEINNPVGFVRSNLETLHSYLHDLLTLLEHYALIEAHCTSASELGALRTKKQAIDLDFIREDAPALLDECRNGLDRVRKIVADLREFSCEGTAQWQESELQHSMNSALNLLTGDALKGITITRNDVPLPPLYCCPSQLNQVFLALLRNAAQAIAEQGKSAEEGAIGSITINSGSDENGQQWVEIADSGNGIAPASLPHIFEPFFTTRPVGKGTGMGLATCFGIVSEHGGRIEVNSPAGAGARFRVILPFRRPATTSAHPTAPT